MWQLEVGRDGPSGYQAAQYVPAAKPAGEEEEAVVSNLHECGHCRSWCCRIVRPAVADSVGDAVCEGSQGMLLVAGGGGGAILTQKEEKER